MAKLGDRVIFYPRVPYGRQHQLAGLVTRVVGDGVIDLVAFPSGGESLHLNAIRERSEEVQIYCWEAVDAPKQLVEKNGALVPWPDYSDLALKIESLTERLTALETRRGPGRPPKDVA